MLARLEAHVAEQQRFAANASHELRTPLAITQTLLDVARNDPDRDTGELVDRLHAVNTRAIDLTEALLLLSRADQRSFTREHVDLSLVAEEAAETLLPLAEERGLTIETSGDTTPTVGSHALLLQLVTNLVHNAIVHNLPEEGTVRVTTSAEPKSAVLTVENTGESSPHGSFPRLPSRFFAATNASAPTTQVSASASQSSRASPERTTEPSSSHRGPPAGSASRCTSPPPDSRRRRRRQGANSPATPRFRHRLEPHMDPQRSQQASHVVASRLTCDAERGRIDLVGRSAARELDENLVLPGSKRLAERRRRRVRSVDFEESEHSDHTSAVLERDGVNLDGGALAIGRTHHDLTSRCPRAADHLLRELGPRRMDALRSDDRRKVATDALADELPRPAVLPLDHAVATEDESRYADVAERVVNVAAEPSGRA